MELPCKLAIRTEGNWIVAYLSMTDDVTRTELSRLNKKLADKNRAHFDDWHKAMAAILVRIVEGICGETPELIQREPPAPDRN